MFSDIFQVGDAKISNFTMGVATDSTKTSEGLMGLGRSGQEIPSILTSMVSQGLINSHAFSLYLNDVGMFPVSFRFIPDVALAYVAEQPRKLARYYSVVMIQQNSKATWCF